MEYITFKHLPYKLNRHTMKKIFYSIISCSVLLFSSCIHTSKTDKPNANEATTDDLYYVETDEEEIQPTIEVIEQEAEPMEAPAYRPAPKKSEIAANYSFATGSVSRGGIVNDYMVTEPTYNTESYASTPENNYKEVSKEPLSTFSIDVDAASYTNTRRMINNGQLPPKDAVRIEEFINYFSYDYPQPTTDAPFSINTEYAPCPWNTKHQLLHVGLQGKRIPFSKISAMNLVFLIDVSGSMSNTNKLPLLKKSLTLLTNQLRENDLISIVVYAGAAGVVLEPTSDKTKIINALERLNAGGSTAGGAGIKLAYKLAKDNYIENGINRVIIATDGDFNVGASSDEDMTQLVEDKRDDGIFLTALGFGMGNYKDSKMETIADKGNGNYFYIDNLSEARKTLVTELDGTLYTIAKDVKIQIEFNPANVKAYRLIGYVNRKLNKEDFNNDKKDAGELGAGHTVTALYEIIPAGSDEEINGSVDELRYKKPTKKVETVIATNEVALVKLRYKKPKEDSSKLLSQVVTTEIKKNTSNSFNFSAAVVAYGMLLSKSDYANKVTYSNIIEWANKSKEIDTESYRSEFIQLVKTTALLDN